MADEKQPKLTAPGEQVLRRRQLPGLLIEERIYFSNLESLTHAHPDAIFCTVLQGGCTEIYGRKTRHYQRFDSEFLPPGHEHALKFHAPTTRCLSLQIVQPWLERAREYGLRLGESMHSQGGVLMLLFAKVYRELRADDEASCLAIEGLTAEMLAHVSRRSTAGVGRRPRWLERARELLHANFSDQLKLYEVADEVGVHPAHLAREFRRQFGKTMGQYVRELRVRRAIVELSRSQNTIAEIGARAGFADQSHFSRIFKSQTGMTPGEYRQTFAATDEVRRSADRDHSNHVGEMSAIKTGRLRQS